MARNGLPDESLGPDGLRCFIGPPVDPQSLGELIMVAVCTSLQLPPALQVLAGAQHPNHRPQQQIPGRSSDERIPRHML